MVENWACQNSATHACTITQPVTFVHTASVPFTSFHLRKVGSKDNMKQTCKYTAKWPCALLYVHDEGKHSTACKKKSLWVSIWTTEKRQKTSRVSTDKQLTDVKMVNIHHNLLASPGHRAKSTTGRVIDLDLCKRELIHYQGNPSYTNSKASGQGGAVTNIPTEALRECFLGGGSKTREQDTQKVSKNQSSSLGWDGLKSKKEAYFGEALVWLRRGEKKKIQKKHAAKKKTKLNL